MWLHGRLYIAEHRKTENAKSFRLLRIRFKCAHEIWVEPGHLEMLIVLWLLIRWFSMRIQIEADSGVLMRFSSALKCQCASVSKSKLDLMSINVNWTCLNSLGRFSEVSWSFDQSGVFWVLKKALQFENSSHPADFRTPHQMITLFDAVRRCSTGRRWSNGRLK